MLILVLSEKLELRFVSSDSTASFHPHPDNVGQPLESALGLIVFDPGLPLECRALLKGTATSPHIIGECEVMGFTRRIFFRKSTNDGCNELIVTYQAGELAPRLQLDRVRTQLVAALDAIEDPVAYFDSQDRLVMCNRSYEKLHSGPEGQIMTGMSFEDILRIDLRNDVLGLPKAQHEEWLQQRLAQRGQPTFEREMQIRDGRFFRVTERATSEGGRVHVLIDITRLKSSQGELLNVVAGSRVGTWTLDLGSGEGRVNQRWAEMLGIDIDTLGPVRFEDWRELVHPDDLEIAEAGMLNCITGVSTSFEVEYRMQHRLGHWVWLMGRGGVSGLDVVGQPQQISGVVLDITRRKDLEAELAMRAMAIAITEEGITITDPKGIILYTNRAHAEMFAQTDAEAMVGQTWYSLYSPQAAAAGRAEALRADGLSFEQNLSLTEMPDGKIICVSRDKSIHNNIERVRLELRDSVQKAQRQEIVNLLAAGLSHDVTNIVSLISHLSDPVFVELDIERENPLEKIHVAARQVLALMDPIRNVGRQREERQELDLGLLVREAADVLRLGAPYSLDIRTNLPSKPVIATVDQMQFMQVLLNLGLNARDALDDGPQTIEIAMSLGTELPDSATLEVGRIPKGRHAIIMVRDTGTGISPAVRSRLWEPYFTTKEVRGTGLGLPVIAEIVRDAGGGIALETVLGKGSIFYVAWPLIQKDKLERYRPVYDVAA